MIGNNACGSRALGYGRTVGQRGRARRRVRPGCRGRRRRGSARWSTGTWRTSAPAFGRFTRQVSGYSLEHLLPENGRSLDRFLVGSEGTLAVVRGATVRLVEDDPDRHLVVLGYPSMVEAADAVPALLAAAPSMAACEGLDSRIVDLVAGRARAAARRGLAVRRGAGSRDRRGGRRRPARSATGWSRTPARRPRCGGSARTAPGWRPGRCRRPAHSGWEDAAVPPERLGA